MDLEFFSTFEGRGEGAWEIFLENIDFDTITYFNGILIGTKIKQT